MKFAKYLCILSAGMCIPGAILRAQHFMNGFDSMAGLPIAGNVWLISYMLLLVVCAVVYAICALPLRSERTSTFERLLGTDAMGFRMAAAVSGLLLCLGGIGYLYLTLTVVEANTVGWARLLEIIYSVGAVAAGVSVIGLAKAQGKQMTARSAMLTLVPLMWGCVHLLVNYRMTCIDPNLPSFAFGLLGDVLIVLALYFFARLLYGKPRPEKMAFFAAAAVTLSVSDMLGYGAAWMLGDRAVAWTAKMVLRGGMSVAVCVLLAAELAVLVAQKPEIEKEVQ